MYSYKKSFKVKILLPTVLVLAALVVILNIFLSVRFSDVSNSLIDEKLAANINSLKHHLEESRTNSRVAAVSMAVNPDAAKAVKRRDRDEILRLFAPMTDLYRITYFTICDNEGMVLVRTFDPDHFGDPVVNQQNVKNALDGEISTYFESGTAVKVSTRTGAPIYDEDGSLLGVVSAGVRFDLNSAVEGLKTLFNSEVTVFWGETRIATTLTLDGQSAIGTKIDPLVAKVVIEGRQEYHGDLHIFGKPYKAFYMPLLNAQGEAFATIFLGIPETEIIMASNKSIRDGIIIGLCGLAVSVMFLSYIMSSISQPIIKLASDMNHIANGNLSIAINAEGEDEVGRLGKSLQKVADTLRKLLNDINIMIAEHEKGNTDHCLNTGEFLGDYKMLADNILELVDLGMKDQLTGIPNRRSFDNRLYLEWNRAMREKKPIGVLLIDVDKFKHYNDAFGHPQGDVALQAVAKTVHQSVKRAIDFAARWGGEEFIVLLPATDETGVMAIAESIREKIGNTLISCVDAGAANVTVSIGAHTQIPSPDVSLNEFVAMADGALYRAKRAGRNKVVFSGHDHTCLHTRHHTK